ncbi:MAG: putative virulence factor Mce family protein, partial [Gemmatimonadetes bacterium]|nr:putative virulence factor Mce family protein [Gemmatimonadota bacterium]
EGNVGKLMKDTLLYRDLRGLVTQADSLLADIKANPKKYINLKVF